MLTAGALEQQDPPPSPATHQLTQFANANEPASEERKEGEEEDLQEELHETMGNNNEGPTDPVGPPPVVNSFGAIAFWDNTLKTIVS